MPEPVAFFALIKSVSVKRTASEDQEARLVVDFVPDAQVMADLVRLSQLEEPMWVSVIPQSAIKKQDKTSSGHEKTTGRTKGRAR